MRQAKMHVCLALTQAVNAALQIEAKRPVSFRGSTKNKGNFHDGSSHFFVFADR
jgi:hypothetical protein